MKKYLKMSDVFKMSVIARNNDGVLTMNDGAFREFELAEFYTLDECEYASHAINSHDELVAMNNELLAALECAEGFVSEVSEKTGFGQAHTLKVVRAAIAKAKGGAA